MCGHLWVLKPKKRKETKRKEEAETERKQKEDEDAAKAAADVEVERERAKAETERKQKEDEDAAKAAADAEAKRKEEEEQDRVHELELEELRIKSLREEFEEKLDEARSLETKKKEKEQVLEGKFGREEELEVKWKEVRTLKKNLEVLKELQAKRQAAWNMDEDQRKAEIERLVSEIPYTLIHYETVQKEAQSLQENLEKSQKLKALLGRAVGLKLDLKRELESSFLGLRSAVEVTISDLKETWKISWWWTKRCGEDLWDRLLHLLHQHLLHLLLRLLAHPRHHCLFLKKMMMIHLHHHRLLHLLLRLLAHLHHLRHLHRKIVGGWMKCRQNCRIWAKR
ncbi:hypothetical protein AGMMS49593_10510 [Endomicrobiia bacterium]|nr:hypothetical protein AGMMS49593_10510 [Endomicrobiia bacterium]